MTNFDMIYNRQGTGSGKWEEQPRGSIPKGCIPMSVAEYDYAIAPALSEALKKRAEWPFFGYDQEPDGYREAIVYHYKERFGAEIKPEWIVNIASVMPGANRACAMAGGSILYNVPMYSHIRVLTNETQLPAIEVPMKVDENNVYSMDLEAMERMITPETTTFILCNPHNPVGRSYRREELVEIVDFCKKHNLLLVSDEIHCEIMFDGKHIPCFSINEEAADISITLNSAGKILNIPGLPAAIAIIPNEEIRKKYKETCEGLFPWPNIFALEALKVNYDGSAEEWKDELRAYMKRNRDYMESRIKKMPGVKITHCEATYLAWMDCSELKLETPYKYFLEECNVYFIGGHHFGDNQFVRVNFACVYEHLVEAMDKLEIAVKKAYDAAKKVK